MSQTTEQPQQAFSHDLTLKSIFAEPRMVEDLIAFLAERLCPELRGWIPERLSASSAVTTVSERPPHQVEGHRDMVWILARDHAPDDRMLLHLEFQSGRDPDMSERMFRYALNMSPSLRSLEVCGVILNTGLQRFGKWWSPVQTDPGSSRYGFQEGPLLDIHDYRVSGLPNGVHPLLPDNLVSGLVALARVQAEMKQGRREAVEQILPVLQEWIVPRALATSETLRQAFGAWFKTGFDELLEDYPELRAELSKITYIEEAEAVMYTFGQYVADERKESEARGEARGRKQILLEYIRQVWGDAEADRCARELDAAELSDLPDIAGLMADQAAGRLPRLYANGRTESST